MDKATAAIVAVISAVIGLAVVSVLVSRNAQTSSVIQSSGSALANVIQAAVAPVAGGSPSSALGGLQQFQQITNPLGFLSGGSSFGF